MGLSSLGLAFLIAWQAIGLFQYCLLYRIPFLMLHNHTSTGFNLYKIKAICWLADGSY